MYKWLNNIHKLAEIHHRQFFVSPVASLRTKGAPRRRRVPSIDCPDNPTCRGTGWPPRHISKNYGFRAAFTRRRSRIIEVEIINISRMILCYIRLDKNSIKQAIGKSNELAVGTGTEGGSFDLGRAEVAGRYRRSRIRDDCKYGITYSIDKLYFKC